MTEVSKVHPVGTNLYPFGYSVRLKHIQVFNPNDFSCFSDSCTQTVPKRVFFFNGSFVFVAHSVSSFFFLKLNICGLAILDMIDVIMSNSMTAEFLA